jgi:hypothetical protein
VTPRCSASGARTSAFAGADRSLRKKSEFRAHLLASLILTWGVGLIFNARDAYMDEEPTEEQIRREMQHMR